VASLPPPRAAILALHFFFLKKVSYKLYAGICLAIKKAIARNRPVRQKYAKSTDVLGLGFLGFIPWMANRMSIVPEVRPRSKVSAEKMT